MNLATLRSYIDTFINTKYGEDKITGAVHNLVLHEMITSLLEIAGTGFGGDLLPTDNPGAQSAPVYFMASETGTYTFCGGVVVTTIPAFVVWTGTAWSAKNIGLPQGVGEASKCQGLAFANDPQPLGKSIGDWYVFMGGGSLTWSIAMLSPGIVYLKSTTGGDAWGYIPFGGDARFRGVIEPGFSITGITHADGDYYIARTGGDYSAFPGIAANAVAVTGQLKYNAGTQQWGFSGFSGGGTGEITIDAEPALNSTNAVQSGGVKTELDKKAVKITAPTQGRIWKSDAEGNPVEVSFTDSQVVQVGAISMADVSVGEKKIMVAEKQSDGSAAFGGAIGLLDAIAGTSLTTLLAESNTAWNGDEITLTGNNLLGELGESSQWFYIESDFFLCTSHVNGTTITDGSANWRRNRGTDCLKPAITNHTNIIAQLTTETGWNTTTNYKIISLESKCGTWYRASDGGYLYMCVNDANGWVRIGFPSTVDMEITIASHPVLTSSLAAYDFATNGFYLEGTNTSDEPASQGQEWWDTTNKKVYRRNMNGYWAKLN